MYHIYFCQCCSFQTKEVTLSSKTNSRRQGPLTPGGTTATECHNWISKECTLVCQLWMYRRGANTAYIEQSLHPDRDSNQRAQYQLDRTSNDGENGRKKMENKRTTAIMTTSPMSRGTIMQRV